MKARIERGYWCFYPPTCYEYKRNKEHGKLLTPIEPAASVMAEGLIDFAEDRLLTQTDFLNYLITKNFHILIGKDIKKMRLAFVKRLLTERIYAGIVELESWGISRRKGHHKAIISEETFDKIQAKLYKPERKPRETDNLEFPLRRLVVCSVCGKKMTGSVCRGKYKYYPHYTCNNKDCTANPKNIDPTKMESDFLELLRRISVKEEVLALTRAAAVKTWKEKIKDLDNGFEAKDAERKEIERTIDNYLDLVVGAQSEGTRSRYEGRIDTLDKRLKSLGSETETKKVPDINEALDLLLRFVGTPAETWVKADPEGKTTLYNMIFAKPLRYSLETGFGTPELSLPFSINEHFSDSDDDYGGAGGN